MKHLFVITLAATMSLASVGESQEATEAQSTCNASVIPDMVHGEYEITAGPLMMTIPGLPKPMYPEPQSTFSGTIAPGPLRDFVVQIESNDVPDFVLEETDRLEPNWYWDETPPGAKPTEFFDTSEVLENALDCTIREFPRFAGTLQTTSQEGIPLDHHVRLIMFAPDMMMGSWRWVAQTQNGTVTTNRWVTFRRTVAYIGN